MWSAASAILLQDQIHQEEQSNTGNSGNTGNADCERADRKADSGKRPGEIDDRQVHRGRSEFPRLHAAPDALIS